ncbi:MAG: GNAT family N-acetyltransferase [Pseudomonadota bacterium]
MSAALHLAGAGDLAALEPMVAAYHDEEGIASELEHREAAIAPLLEGSPHGCVYLIGPRRAPVGYMVVTFGWSVEFGGLDGFIDELYIRPGVRGRGMASEALHALLPLLDEAGVRALHLEVSVDRPRLERFYARAGFKMRRGYHLMSRVARRTPGK